MNRPRGGEDAAALLAAARGGDTTAIARAITAIENNTAMGKELTRLLRRTPRRCATVGITGPPGAGKSSLLAALIGELLPRFARVGVLSVDPSSPLTGGAVLGDRVRMAAYSGHPSVFIRSLAARGHLGGVTRATREVIALLAAAQMDLVIVETVGTGQSEVEVAELTDLRVVVCAPGLGDEMQAIKAGVLEIADLIVVNKADLPDAGRTAAHLRAMLHQRGHAERRRLLSASTVTREGLSELADAVAAGLSAPRPDAPGLPLPLSRRDILAETVTTWLAEEIFSLEEPRVDALAADAAAGRLSPSELTMRIVDIVALSRPAGLAQPASTARAHKRDR